MKSPYFIFFVLIFGVFSCSKIEDTETIQEIPFSMETPEGFPSVEYPTDNEYSYARWKLGKHLFFEKSLSRDESISCASCHLPSFAFSDTTRVSLGVENSPGLRNSPSLANVAYQPYFTREGGVATLEMQVLVPVQEHVEFDFNLLEITERLKENELYVYLSLEAYQREIDPYVITRAIATFERSLLSGNSSYDAYFFQNKNQALSPQQKAGLELFNSEKTNCFQCHSGFNFTNYAFENNGLYEEYLDEGRFRLTNDAADVALFKTPSLRNVAITAPYMHDGSMKNLQEVVAHYNSGGENHPHKNQLIKPLNLSKKEQENLISFLQSLTDESFINNKHFQKP